MAQIGADGINGDTQDGVPLAFSLAADKIGHALVFEPENGPSEEALAWNLMTWGQYEFPFHAAGRRRGHSQGRHHRTRVRPFFVSGG
jgi:iron(II)-dependent oxidoreductase